MKVRLACWCCVLGLGAAAGLAAPGWPPPLPEWPCDRVARLSLDDPEGASALAAQLDGQGGDELVIASAAPERGSDAQVVTVYGGRGDGFARIARSRLDVSWRLVAGDLTGDGKDEVIGIDRRTNAVQMLRPAGTALRPVATTVLGRWMIGSLAVSDVRRKGSPELLLAVDTRHRFNSQAEPSCNQLLGYRWMKDRWVRTWQQAITQNSMTLDLLPGDYDPAPGNELVLHHGPSDVSTASFRVWRWNGRRLVPLSRFLTDSQKSTGLQSWVGISRRLIRGQTAVVSHTIFLTNDGMDSASRGELLAWSRGRARAAFRLPGQPLAVGEFRRPGQVGIVVAAGKELALLEAR